MKRLAILCTAVATACCTMPPPSPLGPSAGALVWQLQAEMGARASGTPIEVRDGELWLLTAKHVIDTPPTAWSAHTRRGDILLGGRLVGKHPELDAAVMAFPLPEDYPTPPTLEIDADRLELGDTVWTAGWGGSVALWVTEALAQGSHRLSGASFFGDSGGAVLDAQGRVRGVTVGIGGPHRTHQVWLLPIGDIWDWLDSLGVLG